MEIKGLSKNKELMSKANVMFKGERLLLRACLVVSFAFIKKFEVKLGIAFIQLWKRVEKFHFKA